EREDASLADTPLGPLAIRGKAVCGKNGRALFFVPRDGIRAAGQTSRRNAKRITALYRRSVFEGNRMILITELEGGVEFPVEEKERIPLPLPGETIVLELDESTLKFLIPGDETLRQNTRARNGPTVPGQVR
ncbi:MAG: hypothetical protein LBI85_08680, partial [Spirochaetaceae bacterium]|nr:hypothetical protein [Spirochaetaceae bacterium]